MKRFQIFCLSLIAFAISMAVGFTNSNEIKKDTLSAQYEDEQLSTMDIHGIAQAELSESIVVYAPYLGRPASNYTGVSETLAEVFFMRIRPPPEVSEKLVINNINTYSAT